MTYPKMLCWSCKHDIPECVGTPKFLIDHPTIVPYEKADNDLIYECDGYEPVDQKRKINICNLQKADIEFLTNEEKSGGL